jgi:excisionase family DNA binding protein
MRESDEIPKISGYVSVKEAAEILNVTDKMVYLYIEQKRLPAVRASNVLLIAVDELEKFQQRSVGRPRTKTPPWRISSGDNALFVTSINVQIRENQQVDFTKKLREIRQSALHDFLGTVSRYIIQYQSSPDRIEILLIWKTSVAPDQETRQQALEAFRQALDDVVDWTTARYDDGTVFMHA